MSNEESGPPDFQDETETDGDIILEDTLEPAEEPVEVIFENGKGYVDKENSDKISQQGIYGTRLQDGRLELIPVEVLHLLERKRIFTKQPNGEIIDAKDIVNQLLPDDPNLWVQYLVFRDLRSRGYAVRQGFGGGIGFRVYARGERPGVSAANQLIYVMKEGVPITLTDLDMVTEAASGARKKLVFALVDQNGEVNYYRVAQATLKDLSGESQ